MDRRDDNLTTADLADSGGPNDTENEEQATGEEAVQASDESHDDSRSSRRRSGKRLWKSGR